MALWVVSVKWCGGNPKLAEITEAKHLRKEKTRAKNRKTTIRADLGNLKLGFILQAINSHKGFGVGVRLAFYKDHSWQLCAGGGPGGLGGYFLYRQMVMGAWT